MALNEDSHDLPAGLEESLIETNDGLRLHEVSAGPQGSEHEIITFLQDL